MLTRILDRAAWSFMVLSMFVFSFGLMINRAAYLSWFLAAISSFVVYVVIPNQPVLEKDSE